MVRLPPQSTRTDTLFTHPALVRSLVPIAQLAGSAEVGAAEAPDESFEPGPVVRDRAGAGRGHGEGYGLRPIARCDLLQPAGDIVERLVPAHPLPAGIAGLLGPGAAERIQKPFAAVHDLRRGAAFGAAGDAGGIVGVRPGLAEAAALDRVVRTAE